MASNTASTLREVTRSSSFMMAYLSPMRVPVVCPGNMGWHIASHRLELRLQDYLSRGFHAG